MNKFTRWLQNKGPGALIAAAFIGPGTVTTCTIAGANYGFTLLWTMVLAILATYMLQEMSVRMAIVTGKSLPDVIREKMNTGFSKALIIGLIMTAILIGNGAYEAGNISGASLGLSEIFPGTQKAAALLIGFISFAVLWIGNYKWMERILVAMVIIMSVAFIIAALFSNPDAGKIVSSIFMPVFPENSIFTIVALIGTTVVPYNIFLHASLGLEKWKSTDDLGHARSDAALAIIGGGLISMAIIITAAAAGVGKTSGFMDLTKGLEPVFGVYARALLGLGLMAAGLTSAITAPLAASYVAESCLGWKGGLKDWKFRTVWVSIIATGTVFSSLGFKPLSIISFAQLANGVLLPIIAFMVIGLTNDHNIMGKFANTFAQKLLSWVIWIITVILGLMSVGKGLGIL